MSNRVVPAIYKQVIEDVISAVREDFEEYGVDDNLVGYLQQLWEASLVQTRVAKFVDGDDDSEDDRPLHGQVRNGQSSTLPPTSQLLNQPRGNPYGTEDVKPQIDANGNGAYHGGLRGGSSGSAMMRLRGGAVSNFSLDFADTDCSSLYCSDPTTMMTKTTKTRKTSNRASQPVQTFNVLPLPAWPSLE